MRKKVDERIRTLIENGVKARHRSMFVVIGDKSRDQIVNLHYMLSKSVVKSRPSVLWCYKDKLELSRDSERILGNTFGMCILQDFEALTPNLLARTIETVEGGGLIVLLLRSLSSLTSLYTMVMDVHERFRTESHSQAAGRFNERFLLSLASCKACIVMDDELNILPISSHMKSITQLPVREDSEGLSEAERELKNLKEQLNDDFPAGPLIRKCCTMDQGKAVITFLDAILDKTLRSTVALLAARGRGKSAALGLAIAGAVAAGYSNIFVTAPSPENLKTLFDFVCKGFDMLEYKEHLDYDVVKSTNPDLKKATVRINIYKQHRQTIQYIQPHEHEKLSQVELLVVDEAAAIPLPVVRSLLGPYLVFLSSTVNGYEGTGRSLSLKLLQQLEEQNQISSRSAETAVSGRLFKKIELSESIRYTSGDPIESWLNALLCLDVATSIPNISRLPPPSECDLYYVNRDTLFSYHKDSELFLQRMMALYVASHYKNSPNDLQLMADAPAHHLFVLLGPVDESKNHLPDILCVIQISFEGQISRKSSIKSLSSGHQPSGDQIPWKFCQQFGDTVFPSLSGARIVRIATHPNAMRLGYGSAAVELLTRYFEGQLTQISELDVEDVPENPEVRVIEAAEKASLLEENIKPRSDLPPLLVPLCERKPEKLHYLGVSFGLTIDLFRFWRRHNFAPFFISPSPSSVTGEHTCMILKPLNNDDIESSGSEQLGFFNHFYQVFRKKFTEYLSGRFRQMEYKLAMSILDPKLNFSDVDDPSPSSIEYIKFVIENQVSDDAMYHFEAYTNNLDDYQMTEGFGNKLAEAYFGEKIPVTLSYAQASVLLCIGLQGKAISCIEFILKTFLATEFPTKTSVYLSFYENIVTENFAIVLDEVGEAADIVFIYESHEEVLQIPMEPHPISVEEDLNDAVKQVKDDMKSKLDGTLNPDLLQQYAILDKEAEFENALQNSGAKVLSGGLFSVKSNRNKNDKHGKEIEKQKSEKKRNKHDNSSKSNKRRKS
ncbi:UNVERIFIED_CONTAM: RNA cytidine acetyltransferase 1 [Sesamum radiatum]|uniref:RNA cytidine acetyltransferase n=1 Tax=Sesamum radiatum TaxID=300843 RepID=A0AAW2VRA9_SESRA